MTTKEAASKMKNSFDSDLLHCVKGVAEIEKKYKSKIMKKYIQIGDLLCGMNDEIEDLKLKIDRIVGGIK